MHFQPAHIYCFPPYRKEEGRRVCCLLASFLPFPGLPASFFPLPLQSKEGKRESAVDGAFVFRGRGAHVVSCSSAELQKVREK